MAVLFISSCGKDSDMQLDIINNVPAPAEKVYSTVYGLIFDESQESIRNATVSIAGETTTTDINGYFVLSGFMDSDGALMHVTKDGYFDGIGLIIPYLDSKVQAGMTLIAKESSLTGSSEEILFIEDELSTVSMKAGSFTSDNQSYNGAVNVFTHSTNPEQEDFQESYPGNFETTEGFNRKVIQPYGVIKVELFGENNEVLNISDVATLSIKAPENLGSTPDNVSMYYRDNATGLWIEDGSATLIDGRYVAQIEHFTDWCFGIEWEFFEVSGVVSKNNSNTDQYRLGLKLADSNYEFYFYTSDSGRYRKRIIAEVDWEVNVYDQCQGINHTEFLPGITDDTTLDINFSGADDSFMVEGQINCDSTPSSTESVYVLIIGEGTVNVALVDDGGNFSFSLDDCANQNFTIRAIDFVNNVQSADVAITSSMSNIDLDVCAEEIQGLMQVIIPGLSTRTIPGCLVTIGPPSSSLAINSKGYYFNSTDTFNDDPNVVGEYARYTVEIWVKDSPAGIQPPFSPPVFFSPSEGNVSEDAPFYYNAITPFSYDLQSETDDEVLLSFEASISITENEITSIHNGVISMMAIK